MKLGQAVKDVRGSFGIPPGMHPDQVLGQKSDQPRSTEGDPAAPQSAVDEDYDDEDGEPTLTAVAAAEPTDEFKPKSAKQTLADIGVSVNSQDWSDYVFKGYMEKRILITELPDEKAPGGLKQIFVTFRTVTAEEADFADGLLSEEIKENQMTLDGVSARREMWNMAFAVQKVDDRPLCKPIQITDPATKAVRVDMLATGKEKRRILSKMAPTVLMLMANKYWTLLQQVKAMMENPKVNFLEKP